MTTDSEYIAWPERYNLLGVQVSAATYESALAAVIPAAKAHRSTAQTHLAVHGLVEGSRDPALRRLLDNFDIVAPDGHPVRIGLNKLYNTGLEDRCYGPEFTLLCCAACAKEGIPVYFYGSRLEVVEKMRDNLVAKFPGLDVAGCEPSIFRPLTEAEDAELVQRINDSGAGVVFVGLGCPLQEWFTGEHKGRINAVMIAAGAAFDFHAGMKKQAPQWMRKHSLEWLYRLWSEPGRLWKRYLMTNVIFLWRFMLQRLGLRTYR
ncbi:MAG: WecB/TagA/CpsF family glycosyltransferase [Candidatus Hydrogenedentota bacterium]